MQFYLELHQLLLPRTQEYTCCLFSRHLINAVFLIQLSFFTIFLKQSQLLISLKVQPNCMYVFKADNDLLNKNKSTHKHASINSFNKTQ